MNDTDTDLYELFFHNGPGQPRTSVGFSPTADDIPGLVKTTTGSIWKLMYVDSIDRSAIYTEQTS